MEVELLTIKGSSLQKKVLSLLLPAIDGDLAVLPGHIHLVAPLKRGYISIIRGGEKGEKEEERIQTSGGLVVITPERVSLFLDEREEKQ